ncbi:MAG: CehA/McbA family metallohydrolase [Bacteroidetes bacterium]|nr:CehA/McbA family metallohydrolase [Bacteroidota bacterium]
MNNLPVFKEFELIITTPETNLLKSHSLKINENRIYAEIPANSIFTITGLPAGSLAEQNNFKPEPDDWYAGDIHVHRNCGDVTPVFSEAELVSMMETNDLAVVTLLADMGNGEVQDNKTDLPKVNGLDAVQSKPGRIVHWDAEWHFDPAGVTFENKALGGHVMFLGLKEAHTIWDESTYKILEWGKKQNAISGFVHMQYLNDSIQNDLNCCIPIDFPVETALGNVDFLSEDVWLNDASVNAYYKILNCGFRPGWAAGTDFPCNNGRPLGSLLTYVQVKDKPFTYRKWIEELKTEEQL